MHRRQVLQSFAGAFGAAILTPELARAAAGADWTVGFADLDADLAPAPMRRVAGRAPAGLAGSLYRNGPGKFRRPGGSVDHWFDGDGLMRAFRVADGGEARVEARFVDTPKRRTDTAANAVVTPGFGTAAKRGARVENSDDANAANISVMRVGDEVWALWEAGSPIAMDAATLATKGVKTLRPDLAHMPFLAHPHRDASGDVWSLGMNRNQGLVWRLGRDGAVKSAELIALPAASYIHDFAATERHLVLVLTPWVQDRMVMPYADSFSWRPDQGTKVLVLDKADLKSRRIYELPAFFAFHYGSAWEEADGTIRFDGCLSPDASFTTVNGRNFMKGTWTPEPAPILTMFVLQPDGRARLEATGVEAEFPRVDGRTAGGPRRYTIHATAGGGGAPLFHGLATHDWKTGRSDAFSFGPGHLVEEAVFVPRPGSTAELDGWLLAPSVNIKARATELHAFDARRLAAGPVCTWRAPAVLPVSLHGTFVAA
jgi:carotenoid cleavage dioxygenase-like enzyme